MSFTNQILQPLADAFKVPLTLALGLAALIAVTRTASSLWYRIEHRGRHPLVIRTSDARNERRGVTEDESLNERLLAYLAADGQGDYVIAPGAGRPAAPGVTAEAVEPQYGWGAALLRLAIAREPSFMVDVSWPRSPGTADHNAAVVRISRTPGDRVVASGSFTGNEDELVGIIGCFCITFLRRQPRLRQRTPRWERWSQDPNGYRAYRDGLQNQRQGINTRSLAEEEKARHYEKALHYFDEAARIEPANLLVQLHRAALLELTDQYDRAADIYTMCNALWPEHIETGYRLGNARKNAPDHVSHAELMNHLEGLRARLEVHNLVKLWLRTFRPGRWNPGERHYWQSWMELWLPGRLTKRASYLQAIAIAELLAELSCMLSVGSGCPCGGEGRSLMTKLANHLLKPARTPPVTRLLHPERTELRAPEHDPSWHQAAAYNGLQASIYRSGGRRRDLGWLALFNAACFFSLAIELAPGQIPDTFSPEEWADDCARAAIREIGILVRQPRHELEPDWLATDPDLAAVRGSPAGLAWACFVGLDAEQVAKPGLQASLTKLTAKRQAHHLGGDGEGKATHAEEGSAAVT